MVLSVPAGWLPSRPAVVCGLSTSQPFSRAAASSGPRRGPSRPPWPPRCHRRPPPVFLGWRRWPCSRSSSFLPHTPLPLSAQLAPSFPTPVPLGFLPICPCHSLLLPSRQPSSPLRVPPYLSLPRIFPLERGAVDSLHLLPVQSGFSLIAVPRDCHQDLPGALALCGHQNPGPFHGVRCSCCPLSQLPGPLCPEIPPFEQVSTSTACRARAHCVSCADWGFSCCICKMVLGGAPA